MKTLGIISIFLALVTVGTVVAKNMSSTSEPERVVAVVEGSGQKATFAGGCFWCMEKPFEKLDGVSSVISGYMGGITKNPNYKNYEYGGHVEVVQITYDPEKVSYQELLDVFWRQIDPTDAGGQFYDRGHAYSTAVYFHNDEQRKLAEVSKDALSKSGVFRQPIVTPILAAKPFWTAENYHQDYYKKNPIRYKIYRSRSGRDAFLEESWANFDPQKGADREMLKNKLTPLQYKVTQEDGTEPPFNNTYWNNKEKGVYVDIVSGEPLFSSTSKYDSKTGWPSFSRPLVKDNIVEIEDWSLFAMRTEVRSKGGDSHLGHVFNDGPPPTGLRYCINSASLRFIPVDKLEAEGLGEYLSLFK